MAVIEDGIIEITAALVSGIITFSIGLGLSFYQPLVTLLGLSQAWLIVVLWIVVTLHILLHVARSTIYMWGEYFGFN